MPTISDRIYVWLWLPGVEVPIPAGVLEQRGTDLWFRYGAKYLARSDAVSLYSPELPLDTHWHGPVADLGMPGAIRDAAPDAWGRRVVLNRLTQHHGNQAETTVLSEATYLLESGSDRFGAIDFQASSTEYLPRNNSATLDELHRAAILIESGELLPEELLAAVINGTSMGGARPKASITEEQTSYLAKFSTSSDPYPVVGAEAVSIELARAVGIAVPAAKVVRSMGRDVLLVERFDRSANGRKFMVVSGLTMLGLGEMTARYGSYPELLDVLRKLGSDPAVVGEQLFERIVFNMAITNIDDHLRNHAAFWDGKYLALTPAFDLCPCPRSGETASQAIAYGRNGERSSCFADLIKVSSTYDLTNRQARVIVNRIIDAIDENWADAADRARLANADRAFLWHRQILNPATSYGL